MSEGETESHALRTAEDSGAFAAAMARYDRARGDYLFLAARAF